MTETFFVIILQSLNFEQNSVLLSTNLVSRLFSTSWMDQDCSERFTFECKESINSISH